MKPLPNTPSFDLVARSGGARKSRIPAPLWNLLTAASAGGRPGENREVDRCLFPHLIRLTPVAADRATPCGETIVVAGKDLSPWGIGFFHPLPIPHRCMIAEIELENGLRLAFLVQLTWCRFTYQHWYESGGHFC
jgi:hypothetical protein